MKPFVQLASNMDHNQFHKPLITYSGDPNVFQAVSPSLKGIGVEAVEWKRPFRSKHVHLHPRFIPFEPDSKPDDGPISSLLDQPILHTYWTDCSDVEIYRSTVKDAISGWLAHLKSAYKVKEWLIVLVETDNKKTNKLLPRSSVLDKIKNDFAQKQTERCICLSDPNRIDSKSVESTNSMLHRLRHLTLASYSKTLSKFEENMRAQREKRNELGWNFCHYFLLQEELAFVLEMLEVYDEALVQYDELDALFTQFVLNSHLTDTPKWLLSFQRYSDSWPSLVLSPLKSQPVLLQIREIIANSSVSLLNFRNYLFARQSSLLIKQGKINELASRSLTFLHNCVKELGILDVAFSEEGSTTCWTFVSTLEILDTICGENNEKGGMNSNGDNATPNHYGDTIPPPLTPSDFSVHTANLWDYAREKLYELGELCNLLPRSSPKGDHLHRVISLASGLSPLLLLENGKNTEEDKEKDLPPSEGGGVTNDIIKETPTERLKNALSSKELFEKNYLELCELAMGTYKHLGRIRSAKRVGICLADYYIQAQEYPKAIGFLTDALKTFREGKWPTLLVNILLKLAHCYKAIDETERYIRTCAHLSCSPSLDSEIRERHFNELMNCLENNDDELISPMDELLEFDPPEISTDGRINEDSCPVDIKLQIRSNFPKPLSKVHISIAILPCDPDHEKHLECLSSGSISVSSFPPQGPAPGGGGHNKKHSKKGHRNKEVKEENTHTPISASNSAPPHLSVNNAAGTGRKESLYTNPVSCQEEDINMFLLEINPVNKLDLTQQLEWKPIDKSVHAGKLLCHNSHHALRRKDSQMKGDVTISKLDFIHGAKISDIPILPGANFISLQAKIANKGAYRLGQISVKCNKFELLSHRLGCRYKMIVDKIPGKIELVTNEGENLTAGIEQSIGLVLHTGSNCISQGMKLILRSSFGLLLKSHKDSPLSTELSLELSPTPPFSTSNVTLMIKSEFGPQKDATPIEHKLISKCPWSGEETRLPITFSPPFMSTYKLSSVRDRKFVQIELKGLSEKTLTFSNHQLSVLHQSTTLDIPLVPLNSRSQSLKLSKNRSASYMWEVGVSEINDEEVPLRLEFSVTFASDQHQAELYKYYICFQKFKTQYEIRSRVEPHKGSEFCRVGNMCTMHVNILRVDLNAGKGKSAGDSLAETSLMYEIRADQHLWAICGRTSGVLSLEGEKGVSVAVDVMPMSTGFLSLPAFYISRYIPADPKAPNSPVPKMEPFSTGQVFNRSRGAQIHILPPQSSSSQGNNSILSSISNAPSSLVN